MRPLLNAIGGSALLLDSTPAGALTPTAIPALALREHL
jgi:hypothetical protein